MSSSDEDQVPQPSCRLIPPVAVSQIAGGSRNACPPPARRVLPLPPPALPLSTAEQVFNNRIEVCWERLNDTCFSGDLELFKSAFTELRQTASQQLDKRLDIYLSNAATRRQVDIVSFLLENGAIVGRVVESVIESVMDHTADEETESEVIESTIRTLEMLFDHGLDLQDFPDILHSIADNEPILKYLLSKGANPNGFDDFGPTVLGCTSNETSMKILADNGANLSRENLLHDALELRDDQDWKGHMKFVIEVLGVDINAPAVYAAEGHIQPGSRFYPKWASAKGHAGTALHWAVSGSKNSRKQDMIPKVKYLLERGAGVDVRDDQGLRPADYAKDQEVLEEGEEALQVT